MTYNRHILVICIKDQDSKIIDYLLHKTIYLCVYDILADGAQKFQFLSAKTFFSS